MRLWKSLVGAVVLVVIAIAIVKFLDRNILPQSALNIAELPAGVEVADTGDNSALGNQLFVNHWLLRLNPSSLSALLAGNVYSSCGTITAKTAKVSTLLKTQKSFDYTQCFQHSAEHYVTFIYFNAPQEMALVEYQTN